MAAYRYLAMDAHGQEQQGMLDAENTHAATLALRARKLFVVRLESVADSAAAPTDVRELLDRHRSIGTAQMALFYRQMGMMLRSGLSLLSALETAKSTAASKRLVRVLERLDTDIVGGASLSAAMARQPERFQRMTVQLVKSAEVSGELDTVMNRLADDLERQMEIKSQLVTALIYPAVVTFASIGVALFLVLGVIPEFAKFFAKSGRPLPPVTQSLVDLSDFMQAWGWLLGLLFAAAAVALAAAWRRPDIRPIFDAALLRLPVIGKIILTAAMAKFTWSCALLLHSGITLLEALRVTAASAGNSAISGALEKAAAQVLAGRDLAFSLRHPVLPPLIPQLAAVGEKTGSLDAVMEEMAGYYQNLLGVYIKRMTALVEPLLILLMGGMVGYVYYAFFQALFSAAG